MLSLLQNECEHFFNGSRADSSLQLKEAQSIEANHCARDRTFFRGCPFLTDNACSIYKIRPYVCRANVSFDITSYWCEPERAYDAELHKVEFSGAKLAYRAVHEKASNVIYADIRDFFS